MTRNTKLFKITLDNGKEIQYRTLNITELQYISTIVNQAHQNETAARLAIVKGDIEYANFTVIHQIGKHVLDNSWFVVTDNEMFTLTIEDFRVKVENDTGLNMILEIMKVIPTTSFEYLSSLTFTDLIELMCICEKITKKKLFNINTIQQNKPIQDIKPKPMLKTNSKPMDNELLNILDQEKTVSKDGHSYFAEDGKSMQQRMKEDKKFYKDK